MTVTPDDDLRSEAMRRLKERREFQTHLVTYVLVNAVLVAIWATTGQGYFWPGWVLGGWGIGLVLHAWTAFFQRPITDADLEREVERLRHGSGGATA
jgi:2TM domain-containing protein